MTKQKYYAPVTDSTQLQLEEGFLILSTRRPAIIGPTDIALMDIIGGKEEDGGADW